MTSVELKEGGMKKQKSEVCQTELEMIEKLNNSAPVEADKPVEPDQVKVELKEEILKEIPEEYNWPFLIGLGFMTFLSCLLGGFVFGQNSLVENIFKAKTGWTSMN